MEPKELLFFAIFLAYWVFSILAKKFMKQQKPAENKGFTLRVLEFIAALKEASEKGQEQIGLPMNMPAPVEPPPDTLTVKRKEVVVPSAGRQSVRREQMEFVPPEVLKRPQDKRPAQFKAPVVAPIKLGRGKKFPRQKLRDAIVWSEILGPPVGLRGAKAPF
jgi:hypothetical protein